ncbi:Proteasome subunit beta type-7 [Coemansia thaxteri]|uniref:Proteasome subunit beta n=1 Tax=Coemansia thaxteri TaxID=2663907 RepID=A0A9W8BIH6_9FUNG|nr:Proteasome subunit beta type-7 [Coemansia thaxteri]KAJ2009133.1 Proteasome subunit beta type-7 [Coemansia thaxteri]KAJ2473717.1 Proteasome subunit beta type-7 [Coemansia sp. RSA 2322]KAJ2486759.1 Proteasome subunit beta type-7 [Coemansia sp. RSA 2320]
MDPIEFRLPHTIHRPAASAKHGPVTRTTQPIVTGTSVVAFKYKDGIMMAADCLASYGSLARFRNEKRLMAVGETTLLGVSGDMSDFQHLQHTLEGLLTQEYDMDDGQKLGTKSVYKCISNIMYNRRSKTDPLWNSYVIGGIDNGQKFLGFVDLYGTTYQSTTISTGFGGHLAQPILRRRVEGREDEITEEEAVQILEECMRVLFYRDARSLNKLRRAKVTAQGVEVSEPYALETNWDFAESIVGYGS